MGSSSSSLSRPQLPLPGSASCRSTIPSVPLIHRTSDTRGSAFPDMIKNVPSQLMPVPDATNYYVLMLEASGIPPGSVLVNPHTGGTVPVTACLSSRPRPLKTHLCSSL